MLQLFSAAGVVGCLAGCSLFDDEDLEVTAESNQPVVSPFEAAAVTVEAENLGSTRVRWGEGSSSCQLSLVVRIGNRAYPAPQLHRVCTADVVDWELDPGATRQEVLFWNGYVFRSDSLELLPPGAYLLRGAAGASAKSAPLRIDLVAN